MKKITLIFLSFVIYFNSITLANAATVGGWSLGSPIAQGASSVYTGTKNIIINGADYVKKGTAIVTPTVTGVAKVLAKGVAGVALSVAVEQLLGAVDWVLDPVNNQITYTKPQDPNVIPPSYEFYYLDNLTTSKFTTSSAAFQSYMTQSNRCAGYPDYIYTTTVNSSSVSYFVRCSPSLPKVEIQIPKVANPNYDPDSVPEDQVKTIPLEVVAAQVISNAEGNTDKKVGAQVATGAAAADIVAEAEADQTGVKARPIVNQLESSSTTKPADEAAADKANEATGEQTKNPDKPDTTDLKLTFPIFCNWAPTVCEAAQTVISFPKTLTNWWETGKEKAEGWATSISESWTQAKEWASSETNPEDTDTEVVTIEEPLPNIDTGIFQASGQCPPDFSYPFPLPMGGTYTVTYSYATACYWFSKVYYIVVSVAWVIAFRIVTNTNTGNSENG